jgi:hypothetical protein
MIYSRTIILSALCLALCTNARAQQPAATPPTENSPAANAKSNTTFVVSPSLGVTLESISNDGEETFAGQWLTGLRSKLYSEGDIFQLSASLDAKYGQFHSKEAPPVKTTDDLILSVTPSVTVIPKIGIRLFLEVTGETQMAEGTVDSATTNFLDPLFLYQSIFLGKRFELESETQSLILTTGAGYAFQQTFTTSFVLEQNRQFVFTDNIPLNNVQQQVTIESGYSAMVDLSYRNQLSSLLSLTTDCKTFLVTKKSFADDIKNARVASLIGVGLQYSFLSLDYSGHVVYDRNISLRRSFAQSLVFGFRVNL